MQWFFAGLLVLVFAAPSCKPSEGTRPAFSPSALSWSDRFEVWDTTQWDNKTIALVYVFTTVPDFMQRADIYVFNEIKAVVVREDLLTANRRLSFNLDDNYKQTSSGGYTARVGKSGKLNLNRMNLAITFDKGKDQIIEIDSSKLAQQIGAVDAATSGPRH